MFPCVQYRAILPLNPRSGHYMFLLTKSRQARPMYAAAAIKLVCARASRCAADSRFKNPERVPADRSVLRQELVSRSIYRTKVHWS